MSRPTETDAKLKNCPFCGNEPKLHEVNDYVLSHEYDCFFTRAYAQEMWLIGKKIIAQWNNRPAEVQRDELAEALEECKAKFQAYATHHAAAGKDEKAEVNRRMVRRCEQALATKEGVV